MSPTAYRTFIPLAGYRFFISGTTNHQLHYALHSCLLRSSLFQQNDIFDTLRQIAVIFTVHLSIPQDPAVDLVRLQGNNPALGAVDAAAFEPYSRTG